MQPQTEEANGPEAWTVENAAAYIQRLEEWTDAAGRALLRQMLEAARNGELRAADNLVTPADVNAWLERQGTTWRWGAA